VKALVSGAPHRLVSEKIAHSWVPVQRCADALAYADAFDDRLHDRFVDLRAEAAEERIQRMQRSRIRSNLLDPVGGPPVGEQVQRLLGAFDCLPRLRRQLDAERDAGADDGERAGAGYCAYEAGSSRRGGGGGGSPCVPLTAAAMCVTGPVE
jgi:hypothetical protein